VIAALQGRIVDQMSTAFSERRQSQFWPSHFGELEAAEGQVLRALEGLVGKGMLEEPRVDYLCGHGHVFLQARVFGHAPLEHELYCEDCAENGDEPVVDIADVSVRIVVVLSPLVRRMLKKTA